MSISKNVAPIYPKRSSFNRNRLKKFDCDMGYLVPIEIQTMYPGDKVRLSADSLIRTLPLVCPPYTSINAYINAYFVSYRALDENFEGFITGGEDGLNDYVLPTVSPKVQNEGSQDVAGVDFPEMCSTWDYLGFPMHPFIRNFANDDNLIPEQVFSNGSIPILKYPFMAIDNIWNEYYRNQNLEDEIELGSSAFSKPNKVHWSRDYFTDSLPFQQRGPAPAIPILGNMNIDLAGLSLFPTYSPFAGDGAFEQSQVPLGVHSPQLITITLNSNTHPRDSYILNGQTSLTVNGSFPGTFRFAITANEGGVISTGYYPCTFVPNLSRNAFVVNTSSIVWSPNRVYSFALEAVSGSNVLATAPLSQNLPGSQLPPVSGNFVFNFDGYEKIVSSPTPQGYRVTGVIDAEQSGLTAASISDLRTAFQCQLWMERNARAGVRYCEFIQSHFGIHPADERLQRPEYIGGTKFPIIVNEVVQNSQSTNSSPLGTLGGRGVGGTENGYIGTYSAKEFGVLVVLMYIKPKNEYSSQGVERQWTPRSKFDFFSPEFSHLAMQGIKNQELFVNVFNNEINNEIFGYTGIWDDLRDNQSQVCGNLRPDIGTFGYWSLARSFETSPTLSHEFIQCNPDKRIFAVQDENPFICLVNIKEDWLRPLPRVGEPGYLDHPYI